MPAVRFDLSGRVALEVDDPDRRTISYLTRQLDPFVPAERTSIGPSGTATLPTVALEVAGRPAPVSELQRAADDDLVTATDETSLYVRWDGRTCRIPAADEHPARFVYDARFPLWRIFRQAVRPALQVALPAGGAVAVHASSVECDGRAILVAGWSESGKTETALALMEAGASFLSDKWTIAGTDGEASTFPIGVGVRRWVLEYLPTLRASLTPAARLQFAGVGAAGLVLEPAGRRPARTRLAGAAVDAARRAMALGDRAAFSARALRAAYGQDDDPTRRLPIGAVFLLQTVPADPPSIAPADPPSVVPADPAWAADRLARTAAYERRAYVALQERAGYALPSRPPSVTDALIAADLAVLREVLVRVPVFVVRAPFPTDPRPVAEAILAAL